MVFKLVLLLHFFSYSLIRFLLRKKSFTDGTDGITVYVISRLRTLRAFSNFIWPIRLGSQSPDIIYCLSSETSQYVLTFPCWLWFGLLKNDQTRETASRHLPASSLIFLTLFQPCLSYFSAVIKSLTKATQEGMMLQFITEGKSRGQLVTLHL